MNNNIVMSSDQINEIASSASQGSTMAMDASGSAGRNFDGLDSFFGGAGEISKQLGAIDGSLDYIGKSIARQGGAQFDRDVALANVADAIDVPMDFVSNEASRFTQYNNALLEKLDGRSVNEGNETSVDGTIDGSIIGEEEQLGNITNENGTREEVYDDRSSIGKEQEMANITRAGGEETQSYDERSGIGSQETMTNIAKAGGEETQEYDGNSRVTEGRLTNINTGGGTSEQSYNDNSKVVEEKLVNINKGSGLSEQELREQARMNAQNVLNGFAEGQGKIGMPDLSMAGGAIKEAKTGDTIGAVKMPEAQGVGKSARENALSALEQLEKM